ncbi:response regulator transcription factor [Glaciecola petra]|uniref:Response regulator transcription factor n=1 Tax=Glaciecola petra TaxID=3075602 RepID=A0ABU2ZRW0_9ALTE|nr:response regulator transcription factor [Aestuariibacter sp. P117]MDT0595366.1 response regulator transcription factor [Aestuariibacter sp. P117]
MSNILIVEDEASIADAISKFIEREGFKCSVLGDANNVLEWIAKYPPDLIILDIMLPGGDGIDLCNQIRKDSQVPIILLSAKVSESERILGLRAGADDYICKPFSAPELMLRVKVFLKRTGNINNEEPVNNKKLQLNNSALEVSLGTNKIELTKLEFKLISVLSTYPNRIYSREKIIDLLYSDYRVVSDRTIDSHVSKLRKKLLQLSPAHELLISVYGAGYKYNPLP